MDNFSNAYATTLGGAVDNATTSIPVASVAGAPACPFRALIDGELVIATSLSALTYTVTRGAESSGATAHSSGAAFTHIVTAAELNAFVGGPSSATAGHLAVFADTSGRLLEDGGAVPSGGMSNPMTSQGDIITGGASGAPGRLAIGGAGKVLTVNSGGTAPEWDTPSGGGASLPSYDTYITSLSGLVHRWKFNEASGNFADSVNGLALAASGSIGYQQTDPFGNADAAHFVASSGKGTSSGSGSIPLGADARTFVALFKINGGSTDCGILTYGSASNGEWFDYKPTLSSSALCDKVETWGNDLAGVAGPRSADTNWHLAGVAVASPTQLILWIDGSFIGTVPSLAINTQSTNFIVDNDGADLTIADLAVFSSWIGTAKLSKLWDIVRAALS